MDDETVDVEIITTRGAAKEPHTTGQASFTEDDAEDFAAESDSDSSCISSDSIMRNADFVSLNWDFVDYLYIAIEVRYLVGI